MLQPSTDHHQLTTFLRNELSEGTVKNYLYEIEKFKRHYKNPEKLNYQELMNYVELLRKNYNPQSIKRTNSLITFFHYSCPS